MSLEGSLPISSWIELFPRLVLGVGFGYFSVIALVFFGFSRHERRYFYLAWLGLCIGLWTFSHLPRVVFGSVVPLVFATPSIMYYTAFMAPIPALLFCRATFSPRFGRQYSLMIWIHVIFLALATILETAAILSWEQLNLPFNVFLVFTCGLMVVDAVHQSLRKVLIGRVFLIGLTSLFLCAVFDCLFFAFHSWFEQHGILAPGSPVTHYGVFGLYLSQIVILSMGVKDLSMQTKDYAAKLEKMLVEVEARKQFEAVARMTQMLAHDVRKPFSILRMGLTMLRNIKGPERLEGVLARLVPEVDKAIRSVDGLIADVMEVGSSSTRLIRESVSPESLIEASLGEVFRVHSSADVTISYDLQHQHLVQAHVQKVGRVLSNILANAVQAVGQKGHVWFRTREYEGKIEFCIGNAGSFIPEQERLEVFDAFFTSGKKTGTGLGLAIAKKIVTAHGGKIWCESSQTPQHPLGQVEFFFTLHLAEGQLNRAAISLPRRSRLVSAAFFTMADDTSDMRHGEMAERAESSLTAEIVQKSRSVARAVKILIGDDEAIYRNALMSYFAQSAELGGALEVHQAQTCSEVLAAARKDAFDLIIVDVDWGANSLGGFELVKELRQSLGVASLICVHSNRVIAADHKTAIQCGADAFLPKPMSSAQLLRLIVQSVQGLQAQ